MSTLLMMAIVLIISGMFAVLSSRRLEEQLPLTAALITGTLYAAGMAGQLLWGVYAVLAFTAASAIVLLVLCIRRRAHGVAGLLITPGTAALAAVFAWLLVCFRQHTAFYWDDFSHWMLAVKNTVLLDAIPSARPDATLFFRTYPPISTLFSYFWVRLSGMFNEGDAQRAINLLMLCFLLPAMRRQQWKRWISALCMALTLFLLPLLYVGQAYQCLYVDALLGCMLLHVLVTWFTCRADRHTLLSVSVTMAMLPLVKSTGLGLAMIALAVMGMDVLLHRRSEPMRRRIVSILLPFAACMAAWLSWNGFVAANQLSDQQPYAQMSLPALRQLINGGAEPYRYEVLKGFASKLVTWGNVDLVGNIAPSVAVLLAAYAAAGWLLARREKKLGWALWMIAAGFAAYTLSLLVMYLFFFSPREALAQLSITRYLGTYLLVMTGFAAIMAEETLRLKPLRLRISGALLALIGVALIARPVDVHMSTLAGSYNYGLRQQYLQTLAIPWRAVQQLDAGTDRVFVTECNDGFRYYYNRYLLTPVQTQPVENGWWPATEHETEFSTRYTVQEWEQLLLHGGYTHVYVGELDEAFAGQYGSLFASPVQEKTLYLIETSGQGITLLALD